MKKLLLLFFFGTMAYAQPSTNPPIDVSACEDSFDGSAHFNLTYSTYFMLSGQDPALFSITYYTTLTDAEAETNAISNPEDYYSGTSTIYVRVSEISNPSSYIIDAFQLTVMPTYQIPELPTLYAADTEGNGAAYFDLTTLNNTVIGDESLSEFTITYHATAASAEFGVNAVSNPESYYAFSGMMYVSVVNNITSCRSSASFSLVVTPENSATPAPTGETTYGYVLGDTLADIPVEGENIQWYETETGDTPLPMSTELTNNTTYYAAQTIAGQESSQRLAVLVYSVIMNINDTVFKSLTYYPNPATNILNIENANNIDSVSISNALGQSVIVKTIDSTTAHIDISSLNKGVYFVKVSSANAATTIKVIKE